jgi:hypothetical protein
VASNRDNQGSHTGSGHGGSQGTVTRSSRGFAAMDQEKQREIARKGGAASARSQTRDEQGQFGGSRSQGGTSQGGTSQGGTSQGGMSQGGGNRGRQGASNR